MENSWEKRQKLLAEANRLFLETLDLTDILNNFVHLVVDYLADGAGVFLLEESGRIRRVAITFADPDLKPVAEELLNFSPDPNSPFGIAKAIRTGLPSLHPVLPEGFIAGIARSERQRQLLEQIGIYSAIICPLKTSDRILGAIIFLANRAEHQFDLEDYETAQRLAERASIALEHAWLYQNLEELVREKTDNLALLQTLVTTSPVGIAFLDRELRYLMINEALAEMNGIAVEAHIGRTVLEVLPELASSVESILFKIIETGVPVLHMEVAGETPKKPGWRRYWESSFYPVKTSAGDTIGLGLIVEEVTERKQYEEKLQRATRALRVRSELNRWLALSSDEKTLLAQSCNILVRTGGYRLAWAGFADETGPEIKIKLAAQAGLEEGYLENLFATWSDTSRGPGPGGAAIRTGQPVITRIYDPDLAYEAWREQALKLGYASGIACPLPGEEGPVGVLCIYAPELEAFTGEEYDLLVELARDLSFGIGALRAKAEKERIQAELILSEERYRLLVDSVQDYAIFMVDPAGKVASWNAGAARLKGYQAAEILGMPFSSFFTGEDQAAGKPEQAMQIATATGHYEEEGWRVRKNGSRFYAHIVLGAIRDDRGNLLGYTKITQDITERAQAMQLLEEKVEERTGELSSLLEISRIISASLDFHQLAGLVLDGVKPLINYNAAAILFFDGDELKLLEQRNPLELSKSLRQQVEKLLLESRYIQQGLDLSEPVVVTDFWEQEEQVKPLKEWLGVEWDTTFNFIRAGLLIPLRLKDKPIGLLSLVHREPGFFNGRHTELAKAVAGLVALALENARLYDQAQQVAILEERQRLARDLHDSVTQLLYSISLSANTALVLSKGRKREQTAKKIEDIISLSKAGLAEMRTILFELRPEALANEGLVVALAKQATALQLRYGLEVETVLPVEPAVPLKIKEAFYRIGLEAINNIAKHAAASYAKISLEFKNNTLTLEIIDNGRGFDPLKNYPGHLGIMGIRERASNIGGSLTLDSHPGSGTSLILTYNLS